MRFLIHWKPGPEMGLAGRSKVNFRLARQRTAMMCLQ
jgi:hypothetical protein